MDQTANKGTRPASPSVARSMSRRTLALMGVLCLMLLRTVQAASETPQFVFPRPAVHEQPKHYVCRRAGGPVATDGTLDESAWARAEWTDDFVDIEGASRPEPRFRTRAKMLWDDRYLYIAAEMEEPHVWATLTERDAVIFHDNDFEVFIDPDGDTHEYYELEVNALGTEWDLLLTKPYRDDGTAIDSWDIQGLLTGITIEGTLNDPGDIDVGWTLELALPWTVLEECAHGAAPPEHGDRWRLNFSRVEWRTDVVDGTYSKATDPESGETLAEDNWVWSPQGIVAMHYPEMWGVVQFADADAGDEQLRPDTDGDARRVLFEIYYRQRTHFGRHGAYAESLSELGMGPSDWDALGNTPDLATTPGLFEASLTAPSGRTLHISHDGHVW